MRLWLHKVEKLVDRIIPPLLLLLLIIIIGDLFFADTFEPYKKHIEYFDIFLISLFAVDLGFKFHRVRKIKRFVRNYWIEIIATIPFFLIFRFIEFFGVEGMIEQGQRFAHEAGELGKLEKEGAAIAKEVGRAGQLEREAAAIVNEAGKASRTARVLRSFRIIARFPRFLKVLPFHEKPTGNHHWHEKRHSRSKKYKAA